MSHFKQNTKVSEFLYQYKDGTPPSLNAGKTKAEGGGGAGFS